MNPFCIPFAITNMAGAMLAMDLGFMGPNYSISTACASGNYCITRWVLCKRGMRLQLHVLMAKWTAASFVSWCDCLANPCWIVLCCCAVLLSTFGEETRT